MKNKPSSEEWLRIAAEARTQMPPPPADEVAPSWFVTRALARRRAGRTAPAPWFALPGLGRAATVSTLLAVACAVLVLSTGGLAELTDPLGPDIELEEFDLP